MNLAEIAVGRRAKVLKVSGLDDTSKVELGMRLLEMGLTPGVEISVLGKAPFGDPIEVQLRGYRLSVRRSEAALVEVDLR